MMVQSRASDTSNPRTIAASSYDLNDARQETSHHSIWVTRTWRSCKDYVKQSTSVCYCLEEGDNKGSSSP